MNKPEVICAVLAVGLVLVLVAPGFVVFLIVAAIAAMLSLIVTAVVSSRGSYRDYCRTIEREE